MLIACCIARDIFLPCFCSCLGWGSNALRCHCFWRFSRPAPLLGKHIITEFVLVLFVSIKAAMDLLSIAILLQLMCAYSYCPVNRAQARAAFMGFVLGEEERHKQNICLQIEFLCLLSLTRVYLIIQGDWVWVRRRWPLCSTPL